MSHHRFIHHGLQGFFRTDLGSTARTTASRGLRVPEVRAITRRRRELSLPDLTDVLATPWHEHRRAALFVLADCFEAREWGDSCYPEGKGRQFRDTVY